MKNFMKILSCLMAAAVISSCTSKKEEDTTPVTTKTTLITDVTSVSSASKQFITTTPKETTTTVPEKDISITSEEVVKTYDIDVPVSDKVIQEKDYVQTEFETKFFIKGLTNDTVNMRSTPTTENNENIINTLLPETEVIVTNINVPNNFAKVLLNEDVGYIKKDFISLNEVELYAIKDTKINNTFIKEGEKLICYEGENNTFYDEDFSLVNVSNENFQEKKEYLNSRLEEASKELLTSFDTYYSYEEKYENKAYNINLCCTEITTIIPKGDNFNWFEIVGNTGKDEGYKLANTYSSGKVVKGYGGGVCQVASTLYNCVLNLNMNVIERHAHGLPVDYVDWYNGKDATVGDIGGPNFIFNNNLGFDIYIKAYTKKIPENDIKKQGKLTIEIFKLTW